MLSLTKSTELPGETVYFDGVFNLLLQFTMINTLISYCNSLVYTKVLSEIYRTQLNPTISYLHQPGTKRFSLSLDISEVFKPLLSDRMIFSLLNKRQLTEDDFDSEQAKQKTVCIISGKAKASQFQTASAQPELHRYLREAGLHLPPEGWL